jgi:hypothetical protein
MRSWLSRLWHYLRRLLVNGDEDTPPPAVDGRPAPDEQIGRELQQFFIELLKDRNLKRLQSTGRVGYVEEYLAMRREQISNERDLTPEDEQRLDDVQRLLNSADLREMEAHIGQITGSRATLLCIVCPPM